MRGEQFSFGDTAVGEVSGRSLKMDSDLGSQCTRRDIVRPAEGRKKVVKHIVVGNVNRCQLQTDFVPVAMEQIVVSNRQIEEASWLNTLRIMIVLLRVRRRNLY